jgi:succinate dehydrogenase flavin-adding protein (antitoxin of CptAB toxin-antitoxin module)
MEEVIDEVVSESSENSVDSLTQGEGNLSMAELASSLMQKRQTEETETTEEESEPVAQSTEEEESEDQSAEEPEESEEESTEPPVQPSDNVLSKFKDLDLDSLSEEESKELAKHLNASAIKRFGKLTAQKKALLAENQNLQAQVEQAPVPAEQPAFLKDNALHNVNDINALSKEVENLNTLMEWADEGMENEVEYDDAGNEYVVKDGDKTYTKADLKRIKANAKKILRKDAPARQKWIQERHQSDQQAAQTFEFLSDGESEDYQLFMQVKQSPLYKPLVDHLPNSNFALGLMVEGLKAVKAKQANAGQPKKLKKPTAPVASAEAGASKPRSEGSKHKKAVQAAHAKFEKSGNIADYQNYIKLKRAIAK